MRVFISTDDVEIIWSFAASVSVLLTSAALHTNYDGYITNCLFNNGIGFYVALFFCLI